MLYSFGSPIKFVDSVLTTNPISGIRQGRFLNENYYPMPIATLFYFSFYCRTQKFSIFSLRKGNFYPVN